MVSTSGRVFGQKKRTASPLTLLGQMKESVISMHTVAWLRSIRIWLIVLGLQKSQIGLVLHLYIYGTRRVCTTVCDCLCSYHGNQKHKYMEQQNSVSRLILKSAVS